MANKLVLTILLVGCLAVGQLAVASSSAPSAPSGAASGKQAVGSNPSNVAAAVATKSQALAAAAVDSAPRASPAEKKNQADQQQLQTSDSFNNDNEYLQIKPEEIHVNEHGKDINIEPLVSLGAELPSPGVEIGAGLSAMEDGQANQHKVDNNNSKQFASSATMQRQQLVAEHKSAADEQLASHLASDTIGSLESHQRPYAMASRQAAPSTGGYPPTRHMRSPRAHPTPSSAANYGGGGHSRPQYPMAPSGGGHYPRPAHNVPHAPAPVHPRGPAPAGAAHQAAYGPAPRPHQQQQQPRYFPKGAAAGYAAFREFVRAQANRYKQPPMSMGGGGQPNYGSRPSGSYANQAQPMPMQQPQPQHYQHHRAPTKVSQTQAYIPHMPIASYSSSSNHQPGGYGPMATGGGGYQQQQQVQGKPEYSKDFGMVIHYPQASIYTQPMTLEQVHKLTGSSIGQVLEQLQHNLALGHARDESNTIKSNNKHHLGHGFSIHAKEYYAPDKHGYHVPTTAAVISSSSSSPSGGAYGPAASGQKYQQQQAGAYQPQPQPQQHQQQQQQYAAIAPKAQYMTAPQQQQAPAAAAGDYGGSQQDQSTAMAPVYNKPTLGSGYARVKVTVSSSTATGKYNNQPAAPMALAPAAYGTATGSGGSSSNNNNNELESLYGPDVSAQIQAFAESLGSKLPVKMSEHDHTSPLELIAHNQHQQPRHNSAPPQAAQAGRPHHQPQARPTNYNNNNYRQHAGPRNPQPAQPQPGYGAAPAAVGPVAYRQHQARPYRQHSEQSQQQMYGKAEQALEHQMIQLLRDFHNGDEMYGSKGMKQMHTSQGYPNKLAQKYQQQQQQQPYQPQQPQPQPQYGREHQAASYSFDQNDNLELPQGPNDQIGEISELIDSLKGSIAVEQPYKSDDSNQAQQQYGQPGAYMSPASHGQAPSYAMQEVSHAAGAYKAAQQVQQNPSGHSHQQPQAMQAYEQQQQQQPQAPTEMAAPVAYGQAAPVAYSQQQQQQPAAQSQAYDQANQAQQAPSTADYQQPQAALGDQQHLAPAGGDYAPQQQQAAAAPAAAPQETYGPQQQEQQHQSQPPLGHQQLSYLAPPAPASPAAAAGGYSSTGHAQVIDHMVEIGRQYIKEHDSDSQQQHYESQPQPDSTSSSHTNNQNQNYQTQSSQNQEVPANQVSVAAPTDSQYQSAQPLSSLIDSLPTDYQELLRQPPPSAALISHHEQQLSATHHESQQQQEQHQGQGSAATSLADAYKSDAVASSSGLVGDILKSAASQLSGTKSSASPTTKSNKQATRGTKTSAAVAAAAPPGPGTKIKSSSSSASSSSSSRRKA